MNTEELKNLTEDKKEEILKEVNTELTSIADHEQKTGQKVAIPSAEIMARNAAIDFIKCKKEIKNLLIGMKHREIVRAVMAFIDLPQEKLSVKLISEDEKLLFAWGQRAINNRYTITYNEVNKLIMQERLKKQQQEKDKQNEETVSETK